MKYKLKSEDNIIRKEDVVEAFLNHFDYWFSENTNGFYGKRYKIRQYLLVYISDKNTPDYNDTDYIYCSGKFDEFMERYEIIKSDTAKDVG